MAQDFLGIPLLAWSGLALLVAVLFAFVWPRRRVNAATSRSAYLILRWSHSFVWLLLAASLFVRATGILGGPGTANILALMALVIYLVFMITLMRKSDGFST